jgi:hypothetical protein
MEHLKEKTTEQLQKEIDNRLYFLYTHNKNYTKQQYYNIIDLIDIIQELKERE